jgi:hypothetical protein
MAGHGTVYLFLTIYIVIFTTSTGKLFSWPGGINIIVV